MRLALQAPIDPQLLQNLSAPHNNEVTPQSNIAEADYKASVAKAIDYIHAGDIFQAVLSQRFSCPFAAPPFALYRALRQLNPLPLYVPPANGWLRADWVKPGDHGARA